MHDIERCIVCGEIANEIFLESTFSGGISDAVQFFRANRKDVAHGQIVRCIKCNFVYTSPQFSHQEYSQIYIASGSNSETKEVISQSEIYRGHKLLKLVRRFIDRGRLLDFGCGSGGFLQVAEGFERNGFEVVYGGKPSPSIKIVTGDFISKINQYPLLKDQFDVITAFDVLEHLADIDAYIEAMVSLLKPGGLFIVSVPNVESLNARIFSDKWNSFLLEHLWYFSPKTLKIYMSKYHLTQVASGRLSYGATVNHLIRRASQTYKFLDMFKDFNFGTQIFIPVPVGLIYGVFKKL